MMSRRRFFMTGAAAAALGMAVGRFAHGMTRQLHVAHHRLSLSGWPSMRIAHLTDLHVGIGTRRSVLDEAIVVTREARPEVGALTGDYLNHSLTHLGRLEELVAALPGPCFATLGNHDYWSGAETIAETLASGGVTVLRNASACVEVGGVEVPLVGIEDGLTHHDDLGATAVVLRA